MTSIRKSVAIAPEIGAFGSGEVSGPFYALPYGAYFTHTARRDAESIYATGSKRRQTAAYGRFSGSWQLDFVVDYAHIHIFEMIFDGHFVRRTTMTEEGHVVYEHKFTKENNTRVGHYVFCEKILNEVAGGDEGSDEVDLIKGAVAKSITITRSVSGSQMTVSLSGVYCDQEVRLGMLLTTDYTEPIGQLTQYSCMFVDEFGPDGYVKDVDSHSITLDMELGLIYNTCTPIATAYYEGKTTFSWNAQTYSNNPQKKFQLRQFSGGKDSDHMKPAIKEMGPMSHAYFVTYSESRRDTPIYSDCMDTINNSPYMFMAEAINSTVTSMTWPNGNGQKMMDVLSSIECNSIEITIRTTVAPPVEVTSADYVRIDEGNWSGAQAVVSAEGTTPEGWSSIPSMDYHLTSVQVDSLTDGNISASMPTGEYFTAYARDKYDIQSGMLKRFEVGDSASELSAAQIDGWVIVPRATPGRNAEITLDVLAGGTSLTHILSDVGEISGTNIFVGNDLGDPVTSETDGVTTYTYTPSTNFVLSGSSTEVVWPSGREGTRAEYLFYAVKGTVTRVGATGDYILNVVDQGIIKVWVDKV